MSNAYDEMRAGMAEARSYMKAADQYANQMADMLKGRLRNCSAYHLAALKKELRDFNMHTGQWKELGHD